MNESVLCTICGCEVLETYKFTHIKECAKTYCAMIMREPSKDFLCLICRVEKRGEPLIKHICMCSKKAMNACKNHSTPSTSTHVDNETTQTNYEHQTRKIEKATNRRFAGKLTKITQTETYIEHKDESTWTNHTFFETMSDDQLDAQIAELQREKEKRRTRELFLKLKLRKMKGQT